MKYVHKKFWTMIQTVAVYWLNRSWEKINPLPGVKK